MARQSSGQIQLGSFSIPAWMATKPVKWGILVAIGVALAFCCCCSIVFLALFGPMLGLPAPVATPGASAFGAGPTSGPATMWPEGWTPTAIVPGAPTNTPTAPLPPGVTPIGTPSVPSGVVYFNAQLLGGSDQVAMMLPSEKDGLETPPERRRDLGWLTNELRKSEPGLLAPDETIVAIGGQPYGRSLQINGGGQDTGDHIKISCDIWRAGRPDFGYWQLDTNWVWHRVKPSSN